MEEEKKLPKNIRQVGEKEEWMRIYLEDYAFTFLHRYAEAEEYYAGVLLGELVETEGRECLFIRGAITLEELTRGEELRFTEECWQSAEEEIGQYFVEGAICGWFLCGTPEKELEKEDWKRIQEEAFPGELSVFYRAGTSEGFWMLRDGNYTNLRGYYIYYDKNFQMQNYLVNRKEPVHEQVSDEAAREFRAIMRRKKQKRPAISGRNWQQAVTVAAAAVFFVGLVYVLGTLASIAVRTDGEKLPALAVGASVERVETGSSDAGDQEVAAPAENTGEARVTAGEGTHEERTKQEAQTEELETESMEREERTAKVSTTEEGTAEKGEAENSGAQERAEEDNSVQAAAVQPSLESTASVAGQLQTAKAPETETEKTEQEVGQNSTEQEETYREAAVVNGKLVYTVRPGDTLVDISIRFYGSTERVLEICEENEISDPNTIFIGQQIVLP